ncbi:MAG: hypothetical protein WCV86_00790 [Patescibacteria group bacterium]|jgi:hypothetical protein
MWLWLTLLGFVVLGASAKYIPLSRDERNSLLVEVGRRVGQHFMLRYGNILLTYTHCGHTMVKVKRYLTVPYSIGDPLSGVISGQVSVRMTDLRVCQRCHHIEEHPRNARLACWMQTVLLWVFMGVMYSIDRCVNVYGHIRAARHVLLFGAEIGSIFGVAFGIGVVTAPATGGWVAAILGIIVLMHRSAVDTKETLATIISTYMFAPHVGGICFGITWLGVSLARGGVGLSATIMTVVLMGIVALKDSRLGLLLGMWLAIMLPAGVLAMLFRDDVSVYTILAGLAGIVIVPLLHHSYTAKPLKLDAPGAHTAQA